MEETTLTLYVKGYWEIKKHFIHNVFIIEHTNHLSRNFSKEKEPIRKDVVEEDE